MPTAHVEQALHKLSGGHKVFKMYDVKLQHLKTFTFALLGLQLCFFGLCTIIGHFIAGIYKHARLIPAEA